MTHRTTLRLLAAALLLASVTLPGCRPADDAQAITLRSDTRPTHIVVHKDPGCQCCARWVALLRENGFEVEEKNTSSLAAVKQRLGVARPHHSCHTAEVGGYVIEGHVPIDLVQRLLAEKPADIVGLAVPGMPMGSPGMEMPGRAAEPYDVIAWDRAGKTLVYERR